MCEIEREKERKRESLCVREIERYSKKFLFLKVLKIKKVKSTGPKFSSIFVTFRG